MTGVVPGTKAGMPAGSFQMKKFVVSLVLIFLVPFLFAQTVSDYEKILKGDFSAFVGYWVNANNKREFLRSDGSQYKTEMFLYGKNYRVRNFAITEGVYTWYIHGGQEGYSIMLFPIGVDIEGIETDTAKTRIHIGMRLPSDPKEVYYRESSFPTTHIVSEDIILKKYWFDEEAIGTLKKGTLVLIHSWQKRKDGVLFARTYTGDGLEGWCSPEHLEEIQE